MTQALQDLTLDDLGVRVITQNMYVGLDVFPIIAAPADQIPFAAAAGFADLVANRPADRMAAIASEIALVRPHLVALQEVTRVFTQFPSDTVLGNTTPNATDEYVDFLEVLLAELARRGQTYEVVVEKIGTDIELPRFDGVVDGVPQLTDVRVKFSDVILRRAGVPATQLFAIHYAAALPIPTIPDTFVRRNAVAVVATVAGKTFRFVSTHLEPLIEGVPDTSQPQLGQVAELIQLLATQHEPALPTIVVGDFNSPAGEGTSYLAMAAQGYTDVWSERDGHDAPGLTCCQDVVLAHPDSRLFERIDLMWTRNLTLAFPVLAYTIGDQPIFRTRTEPRLWPSDHAGVAALLRF
ncbi:MAG TPA: endonuclease/exonuclease/phosphatase family protein [Kofleriaceae bacterium]|nr:endonuclease/exonuclease/phosphatase family protein [Kofleriaceae bacterium]